MKVLKKSSTSLTLLHYGSILFGVSVVIAFISAFLDLGETATKTIIGTLAILGFFIGLLNITNKEAVAFIVAGLAIIMLMNHVMMLFSLFIGQDGLLILNNLFKYMAAFMVPSILFVSLKTIFLLAKDEE